MSYGNVNAIILTVPGECDHFYSIEVPDPTVAFGLANVAGAFDPSDIDPARKVISTIYDDEAKVLHFTTKQYNNNSFHIASVTVDDNGQFILVNRDADISSEQTVPLLGISLN